MKLQLLIDHLRGLEHSFKMEYSKVIDKATEEVPVRKIKWYDNEAEEIVWMANRLSFLLSKNFNSFDMEINQNNTLCSHCFSYPGKNPKNRNLWNGFFDRDTKEHVCYACKELHYKIKNRGPFKNHFSEVPVSN